MLSGENKMGDSNMVRLMAGPGVKYYACGEYFQFQYGAINGILSR